jgi:uncharacterized membrane protein YgdD (TMEM256/DUF423 family)
MMRHALRQDGRNRGGWLAAGGALYAAAGVAVSAYASHLAVAQDASRLQTAALFAFGHGVGLTALAPAARSRLARLSMLAIWLGVALFSGSLSAGVLLHWPMTLAPYGGTLLIAGWLLYAVDLLRR